MQIMCAAYLLGKIKFTCVFDLALCVVVVVLALIQFFSTDLWISYCTQGAPSSAYAPNKKGY